MEVVMERVFYSVVGMLGVILISTSCGKAKELANDINVQGNWVLSATENAGKLTNAVEADSVVLTFKDGKAAISSASTVVAKALYTGLDDCFKTARPYNTKDNQLVFPVQGACPERRLDVLQLDRGTLKFPDPTDGKVNRVFSRIDDDKYHTLVLAPDRKL